MTEPVADLALQDLGEFVQGALGEIVEAAQIEKDELTIRVDRDSICRVLTVLRDDANCQFKQLMDVCGVDYPGRQPRFDVVYNLLSLVHNRRIRVKVRTDAETPVPTCVEVFPVAGWWEREAWDLFGIYFAGHPDLRRIMTDYGFEGHPLRKEFPLTGYVEVRYDEEQKRVIYEPVKLQQDFRNFDFESPWEGMVPSTLPGDEKAQPPGKS